MKTILDKLFANKKLSIMIPSAIALVVYLLFVFFGTAADKTNVMIATPIVSVIGFFGAFLVLFVQIKNPMCPDCFLNLFELLATIVFGAYAVMGTVSFFASGFQNFNVRICLGFVACGAISWAHSKRAE